MHTIDVTETERLCLLCFVQHGARPLKAFSRIFWTMSMWYADSRSNKKIGKAIALSPYLLPRFVLTLSYLLTYLLMTSLNFGSRYLSAAILLQQNVIALIAGSETKNSACALSTVTGIPLVCLHGDKKCKKTVQMMVGHKAYARASLDIINRFNWEKVTLVFEGTMFKYWSLIFFFFFFFVILRADLRWNNIEVIAYCLFL